MRTVHLLTIIILIHITFIQGFSQKGVSAVPFLLISPSADANGMGEASVAILTDNPLGSFRNPALLGCQIFRTYLSGVYNWNNWTPNLNNLEEYGSQSFFGGLNLSDYIPMTSLHLAFGLAYTHITMDYNGFKKRGENNEDLGTFSSAEWANQITFSAAIDYWIKFSTGLSSKWITSNLDPNPSLSGKSGTAQAFARDFGFFISIPTTEIYSKLSRQALLEIYPHFSPYFDISLGTSWTNIGDKVKYIQERQADPLPRTVRNGLGFDLGISYKTDSISSKLLTLRWTIEASDLLILRHPAEIIYFSNGSPVFTDPYWKYQSGFGDLKYLNDLILGKSTPNVEKRKGLEIGFLEFLYIRFGSVEGASDKRFVKTWGFSINAIRFLKAWNLIYPGSVEGDFGEYLIMHFDIRYSMSMWNVPNNSYHPLEGTTFHAVSLSFLR